MYQDSIKNNNNQTHTIIGIKAFTDNYIWCIHNTVNAVVVDPGDASVVIKYLEQNQLTLGDILITHHHWDHVGGLDELKKAFPNVRIYGPNNPKINQIEITLLEGDKVDLTEFDLTFNVMQTPGHTLDHIVYYNDELVFCGDTLFSGGCGRMFEGTPDVFYASLQKLAALPKNIKVYCTHEYTLANLNFAISVEPDNLALKKYFNKVELQREQGLCTLPSTIKQELEINPFLRCHIEAIKDNVRGAADLPNLNGYQPELGDYNNEVQIFADLRKSKDNF